MARKKVNENDRWPIPDDWSDGDGYQLVLFCIPQSRMWRSIIVGQVSALSYGRNWNKFTGTITDVQILAREIEETMTIACLDDIIEAVNCICEQQTILVEQGGVREVSVEPDLSDGEVEFGPGEQFETAGQYYDAKCNVANGIFDTLRNTVTWLDDNNVDLIAGLFGGVTSGLVAAMLTAGPVGWAVALVAGIVAGTAGFLVRYSLNFADLEDAMNEQHEPAVLALYNASDALSAESAFIVAIEAAATPITPLESGLLALMMSSAVVNQLFEPRDDVALYVSPAPIDCGSSILALWTYPTTDEGWVFRDDSESPSFATGVYVLADQALQCTLHTAGGGSRPNALGTWIKASLTLFVPAGSACQMDYSASSDGISGSYKIKVIYDDASFDEVSGSAGTSAGTRILTLPAAKIISDIECSLGRSSSGIFVFDRSVEEVRVVGS